MKHKFKKITIACVLALGFALAAVPATALEIKTIGAGGGGGSGGGGGTLTDPSYSVQPGTICSKMCGFRFSIYDGSNKRKKLNSTTFDSPVVDIYYDTDYSSGFEPGFGSNYYLITLGGKTRSKLDWQTDTWASSSSPQYGDVLTYVKGNTSRTNESTAGINLPDPNEDIASRIADWILVKKDGVFQNFESIYRITGVLYENREDTDTILVEPLFRCSLNNVKTVGTPTDLAIFGGYTLGKNSDGWDTSWKAPGNGKLGAIQHYINKHFPNMVYLDETVCGLAGVNPLKTDATYNTIVKKGYGVMAIRSKDVIPVVTTYNKPSVSRLVSVSLQSTVDPDLIANRDILQTQLNSGIMYSGLRTQHQVTFKNNDDFAEKFKLVDTLTQRGGTAITTFLNGAQNFTKSEEDTFGPYNDYFEDDNGNQVERHKTGGMNATYYSSIQSYEGDNLKAYVSKTYAVKPTNLTTSISAYCTLSDGTRKNLTTYTAENGLQASNVIPYNATSITVAYTFTNNTDAMVYTRYAYPDLLNADGTVAYAKESRVFKASSTGKNTIVQEVKYDLSELTENAGLIDTLRFSSQIFLGDLTGTETKGVEYETNRTDNTAAIELLVGKQPIIEEPDPTYGANTKQNIRPYDGFTAGGTYYGYGSAFTSLSAQSKDGTITDVYAVLRDQINANVMYSGEATTHNTVFTNTSSFNDIFTVLDSMQHGTGSPFYFTNEAAKQINAGASYTSSRAGDDGRHGTMTEIDAKYISRITSNTSGLSDGTNRTITVKPTDLEAITPVIKDVATGDTIVSPTTTPFYCGQSIEITYAFINHTDASVLAWVSYTSTDNRDTLSYLYLFAPNETMTKTVTFKVADLKYAPNTQNITQGLVYIHSEIYLGDLYAHTGSNHGTAYETDATNNAKTITGNISAPLQAEFIEPNASYRKGTEIVAAFTVRNTTAYGIVPADTATTRNDVIAKGFYPVLMANERSNAIVVANSKNRIIPAHDSTTMWFKWNVPEDYAETNVQWVLHCDYGGTFSLKSLDDADNNSICTAEWPVTAPVVVQTPDTSYTPNRPYWYLPQRTKAIVNGTSAELVEQITSESYYTKDCINTVAWTYYAFEENAFVKKTETAKLSANALLRAASRYKNQDPTVIQSGYGITISANGFVKTGQKEAVTNAQSGYVLFPEFMYSDAKESDDTVTDANAKNTARDTLANYAGHYLRNPSSSLEDYNGFKRIATRGDKWIKDTVNGGEYGVFATLKKAAEGGFSFPVNTSTKDNVHYLPIWMPDGNYQCYVNISDVWTPGGMLSTYILSSNMTVDGDMYDNYAFLSYGDY